MKRNIKNPHRFCIISNANQSYLSGFIKLTNNDLKLTLSFKKINLALLKNYDPSVIIIDEYFNNEDFSGIIKSIKMNFKYSKIYFLSPEYADYNGVIQSLNHKNHYYSNLNVDILNHFKSLRNRNNNNNYLEAS